MKQVDECGLWKSPVFEETRSCSKERTCRERKTPAKMLRVLDTWSTNGNLAAHRSPRSKWQTSLVLLLFEHES